MINPWRESALGQRLLVRTVELEGTFWMVPVERPGQALGYISVATDGRLTGHAYLYQDPADLSTCPPTVTRISATEARALGAELLQAYAGAAISDPVYVHDAPHGRLAWMIEVHTKDELITRIFVTPGYVCERKAGEPLPPPGVRGAAPGPGAP
jgi:hypothetical protein